MNLLSDAWIPVRSHVGGETEKITLRDLLCGEEKWELCLPRDDMELAALQLLICMTQILFMPKTSDELKKRIAKPLPPNDYDVAIQFYGDWFQLDHSKFPFMQVRGVKAKDTTPMGKLMAGMTGATNSCFVNQVGLANGLCAGCTAIALFNQASCAPSFGGGFKAGLRGNSPVTTLVQGDHLRRSVWLNVVNEEAVIQTFPFYRDTASQQPTWIEPITTGDIPMQRIGFLRGLLWQPAHIELLPPVKADFCTCCGHSVGQVYTAFKKAKFSYTITDTWPHPHSPRIMMVKKGQMLERFLAFTTAAPAWTQLSRFVVQQQLDTANTEGQQPATVILQVKELYGGNSQRLHLLVGGYRTNKASVLERRHEVFSLNHGWDVHTKVIHDLVSLGRGYRNALSKALFVFVNGVKEIKGAGINISQAVESQFYRRSEPVVESTLARIDFNNPVPEISMMQKALKEVVETLFRESIRPYLNDPELIRTLAVARRTLFKHLNNLEPQNAKGRENGTAESA